MASHRHFLTYKRATETCRQMLTANLLPKVYKAFIFIEDIITLFLKGEKERLYL